MSLRKLRLLLVISVPSCLQIKVTEDLDAMSNIQQAEHSDVLAVFHEARTNFFTSLSKEERPLFAECTSAENMVQQLSNWDVITREKRRGKRMMAAITAFTNQLRPYFEVVTILVQSKPEFAALAWGGLRLILQARQWTLRGAKN